MPRTGWSYPTVVALPVNWGRMEARLPRPGFGSKSSQGRRKVHRQFSSGKLNDKVRDEKVSLYFESLFYLSIDGYDHYIKFIFMFTMIQIKKI